MLEKGIDAAADLQIVWDWAAKLVPASSDLPPLDAGPYDRSRTEAALHSLVQAIDRVSAPDEGTRQSDETEPQSLSKNEVTVLLALHRAGIRRLSIAEIVEDLKVQRTRRSAKTVEPTVRRLIEKGLADRAEGERTGAALTRKGKLVAAGIREGTSKTK